MPYSNISVNGTTQRWGMARLSRALGLGKASRPGKAANVAPTDVLETRSTAQEPQLPQPAPPKDFRYARIAATFVAGIGSAVGLICLSSGALVAGGALMGIAAGALVAYLALQYVSMRREKQKNAASPATSDSFALKGAHQPHKSDDEMQAKRMEFNFALDRACQDKNLSVLPAVLDELDAYLMTFSSQEQRREFLGGLHATPWHLRDSEKLSPETREKIYGVFRWEKNPAPELLAPRSW